MPIFITKRNMKTIILTKKQAKHLLNNLPQGHAITLTLKDAEYILDLPPTKKRNTENGPPQNGVSQQQPQPQPQNQPQPRQPQPPQNGMPNNSV
jgi:hypothetical protein